MPCLQNNDRQTWTDQASLRHDSSFWCLQNNSIEQPSPARMLCTGWDGLVLDTFSCHHYHTYAYLLLYTYLPCFLLYQIYRTYEKKKTVNKQTMDSNHGWTPTAAPVPVCCLQDLLPAAYYSALSYICHQLHASLLPTCYHHLPPPP